MSKLKWFKNEDFAQELIQSWGLWVTDKFNAPYLPLGTLYQLEDKSYVILERGKEKRPMVLDAGLSLDEAKRAAKLFMCVGEAV